MNGLSVGVGVVCVGKVWMRSQYPLRDERLLEVYRMIIVKCTDEGLSAEAPSKHREKQLGWQMFYRR